MCVINFGVDNFFHSSQIRTGLIYRNLSFKICAAISFLRLFTWRMRDRWKKENSSNSNWNRTTDSGKHAVLGFASCKENKTKTGIDAPRHCTREDEKNGKKTTHIRRRAPTHPLTYTQTIKSVNELIYERINSEWSAKKYHLHKREQPENRNLWRH